MSIAGKLNDISLAEVLQSLSLSHQVGRLLIKHGHTQKTLYLDNGAIVGLASNQPQDRIGKILVKQNIISQDQLKHALQEQPQRPQQRLGDILVDLNYITRESLESAYKKAIISAIQELFQWDKGDFVFIRGDVSQHASFFPIQLDIQKILISELADAQDDTLGE